jgi:hypothetical protein
MLLFTDGFECEQIKDVVRKWGFGEYMPRGYWDQMEIVTGWDNSTVPPGKFSRKPDSGRALHCTDAMPVSAYHTDGIYDSAMQYTKDPGLLTYIRKSRTVHVGVGLRNPRSGFKISFFTRVFPGIHGKLDTYLYEIENELVAECTVTFGGTTANVAWSFPSDSCPNIYQFVNKNVDLQNGDWHYFQVGLSLHGNVENNPQAWVETRIGSTASDRSENVFTAAPDSENGYFIDMVKLGLTPGTSYDDIYITNDEGEVNNSFLGPIYIRSMIPETQGNRNDGVPVNTGEADRAQAVNAANIGTVETLPVPLPAPEDDQHFLAWEDPREKYLRLPRKGSMQTFDFSNPNFAGADPKFFGAAAYMMTRPGFHDQGQTSIRPVMKSGSTYIEPTMELRRPLTYLVDNEWEIRRGFFENPDAKVEIINFLSEHWNKTALANAEFGIEVIAAVDDPTSYLPEHLRVQYYHDDLIDEQIDLLDVPGRYWEEFMSLTFGIESDVEYQWAFRVIDNMAFSDGGSDGAKVVKTYVNSVVYAKDEVPWTYLFVGDQLSFTETLRMTWLQVLEEFFSAQDTDYHFWVEEVVDTLLVAPANVFGFNVNVLDDLNIAGAMKTNHEFISDGLHVDSTYIFSGHEFVAETLYPNSIASVGILEEIQDLLDFEEDHFDGWFVAVIADQFSIVDDTLTQSWRYEWFMGVCINSWQQEPIEQEGDDGKYPQITRAEYEDGLI